MTAFPEETSIWQRFTNVSSLQTYYGKKRRDSFDPQSENPLGEDSICMVNLMEIPRVIVFFFCYYRIALLQFFSEEEFCFVKRASKSKCRRYQYTVRSIHVKL